MPKGKPQSHSNDLGPLQDSLTVLHAEHWSAAPVNWLISLTIITLLGGFPRTCWCFPETSWVFFPEVCSVSCSVTPHYPPLHWRLLFSVNMIYAALPSFPLINNETNRKEKTWRFDQQLPHCEEETMMITQPSKRLLLKDDIPNLVLFFLFNWLHTELKNN